MFINNYMSCIYFSIFHELIVSYAHHNSIVTIRDCLHDNLINEQK